MGARLRPTPRASDDDATVRGAPTTPSRSPTGSRIGGGRREGCCRRPVVTAPAPGATSPPRRRRGFRRAVAAAARVRPRARGTLRRLTQSQYANALHDLLRRRGDRAALPSPTPTARGFRRAVGASETSISRAAPSSTRTPPYAVAEQVLARPARRAVAVPCTPRASATRCARRACPRGGLTRGAGCSPRTRWGASRRWSRAGTT